MAIKTEYTMRDARAITDRLKALKVGSRGPADYYFEKELDDGRRLEIDLREHPRPSLAIEIKPTREDQIGYATIDEGLNGECDHFSILDGLTGFVKLRDVRSIQDQETRQKFIEESKFRYDISQRYEALLKLAKKVIGVEGDN